MGSDSALVKLSKPMTLTENGFRRSRALVSVKLMKSDCSTGHAVKARKSRQKGIARIQAARPSRRRAEPTRPGEPPSPAPRDDPVSGRPGAVTGGGVTGPVGDPVVPVW